MTIRKVPQALATMWMKPSQLSAWITHQACFSRVETVASDAFSEGVSLDTRRNLQSIFSCDPVIFFDVELFPMAWKKKTIQVHSEKTRDNQSGKASRAVDVSSCQLYPCLIFLQCWVCLSQLSASLITRQAGRCAEGERLFRDVEGFREGRAPPRWDCSRVSCPSRWEEMRRNRRDTQHRGWFTWRSQD